MPRRRPRQLPRWGSEPNFHLFPLETPMRMKKMHDMSHFDGRRDGETPIDQAVAELRSQGGTPVETPTARTTTEAASFHVRQPLVQSMIEEAPIAEPVKLPERKLLEA